MNLVFDKKTLRALSVFDNSLIDSPEEILKQMFPNDFAHLSLWNIEKNINYNLLHLSIELDTDKNPEVLFYRGKEVYRCSEGEKKKREEKRIQESKKVLATVLPRTLRSSISSEVIKLWVNSPYTSPSVSKSLGNFEYFSEKKIMPVVWWGTFINAGGYANMNRSIVFRLHNYHIIPKIEVVPAITQISQTGQYYVQKYSSFDFRRLKKYPRIYGFGPQAAPRHPGKTIFYTMMETDTLHPQFANLCNTYADEIWVPSLHNQKVFTQFGVKKPVRLMPLGIDEVIYKKNPDADIGVIKNQSLFADILGKPSSQGIKSFRFLTLFGWSFRKGIDILIKSFVKAFNGNDDVALIIASTHVGPDIVKADVKKYAKEIKGSNYPQILFYPHVTPELHMPSIYRMGHAFINTSRGEGFCLPPIEASACGLPVISCNNTGMSEYLEEDNAFLITNDKQEVCRQEMHWISHYYHGQLFPKLDDDQINQAIKHMHFVVNNYDEAKRRGQKLTELVFKKYTWSKAVERVAARIEEIYA